MGCSNQSAPNTQILFEPKQPGYTEVQSVSRRRIKPENLPSEEAAKTNLVEFALSDAVLDQVALRGKLLFDGKSQEKIKAELRKQLKFEQNDEEWNSRFDRPKHDRTHGRRAIIRVQKE